MSLVFDMKKYLKPRTYVRAMSVFANCGLVKYVEALISAKIECQLRYPAMFVVGAPRCGSTLVTQVITEAFDVGYISNRHCAWFGAPALAEYWLRPLANKPQSDYASEQGRTKGPYAPSECGEWWYRFFRRRPPYVTLEDVSPHKMHQFRRSLATLTDAFDRPVLIKNLYASLRIQAIGHYLPECLFIVVCREELDNAHSLLEARYRRFGKYNEWFSVEPPEIDKLKTLPAHEQVTEQIRHIYRTITSDLEVAGIPSQRVYWLSYERFCDDTHAVLDELDHFFDINGNPVRRVANPPAQFVRKSEVRIDGKLYGSLRRYVENTQKDGMSVENNSEIGKGKDPVEQSGTPD